MPQDLTQKYAVDTGQIMGDRPMPVETDPQTREYLDDIAGMQGGEANYVSPHAILRARRAGKPGLDVSGMSNVQMSGDTEFTDYTRGIGKGFVDILGTLAGAVELTGAVDGGQLSRAVEQYGDSIVANMTPSARENMQREWTNLTREGVLANPKAVLQQFMTVLPSLATSMGGAGLAAKTALKGATKAAGKKLTQKQAAKVAATAGAAGGAAVEMPQLAGATINELRMAMDGMSHGELVEFSPEYRAAYKKHGGEAEARQEILLKASRGPAAVNSVLGSMISTVPGAIWGRILNKAGSPTATSLKRHFATTMGAEGAEEVGQEAIAGVTTGEAQQQYIDQRHDPMSGMAERLVSAGALGALGGAAGGAVTAGGRNAPRRENDVDPAAAAALAAQSERELFAEYDENGQQQLFPWWSPDGVGLNEGSGGSAEFQSDLFPETLEDRPQRGGNAGQGVLDFFTDPTPGEMEQQELFGQEQFALDLQGGSMNPHPTGIPLAPADGMPAGQQDMFGGGDMGDPAGIMVGDGVSESGAPTRRPRLQLEHLPPGDMTQDMFDLQGGSMNPPTGGETVPEPMADIEAQVIQMFDPETSKDAVYISAIDADQSQANPFWAARAKRLEQSLTSLMTELWKELDYDAQEAMLPESYVAPGDARGTSALPGGLQMEYGEDGSIFLTTNPDKAEAFRNGAQDEVSISEMLDYPQSKAELPDPENTVTFEVVNKDGGVADTFVLENNPESIEFVLAGMREPSGPNRQPRIAPDQDVRVKPTGIALQERAEKAQLELDGVNEPTEEQMVGGRPAAEHQWWHPTFPGEAPPDRSMEASGAEGLEKAAKPRPAEEKPTKAEKKVKAKAESKRRSAKRAATAEGIAAGIEKGIAKEEVEQGQEVEPADEWWYPTNEGDSYKPKSERVNPDDDYIQSRRKRLASIPHELKDAKETAALGIDDKPGNPVKKRKAADDKRKELQAEKARLEAEIEAYKAAARDNRQGDMFGGRGELPAGTYHERTHTTRGGEEVTARVRPSKRENPPTALMSEGGQDIKLDQPAPEAAPASEWQKRPKKGRKQTQKEMGFFGGAVKKQDKTPLRTRGEAQDKAAHTELVETAERKLKTPRARAGVAGYLKRKVRGGREQANKQEVRALEVLNPQQAGTTTTTAEDAKLASQLRELRKAIRNLLTTRFKMTPEQADKFEKDILDRTMLRNLSGGKKGRQEINRLLKRGALGTPKGFKQLMTLMNDNVRDGIAMAAVQSNTRGSLTAARSLLDTWKGNFGTYKTEQARRAAMEDLFNNPELDQEIAGIYGVDLEALYTGETSSPWSTKGEVKLTNKNASELKRLIAESEADAAGYGAPVSEGDALSVAVTDIELDQVETPIHVTGKGKTIYQKSDAAAVAQEKADAKETKKARAKGPTSFREVQQDEIEAALDAVLEDLGPDSGGGPGTRDGRSRTTSFDGQDGPVRTPDGPSITPSRSAGLTRVKGFIKSHFPELIDRIAPHQLDGIAIMLKRIGSSPDGSYTLNSDGAGVGKTLELLVLAAAIEASGGKVLYVTPNKDIWRQTVQQAQDFGVFPGDRKLGKGSKRVDLTQLVTADGYSTLSRRAGEEYDLVIYDEAHALRNPETLAAQSAGNVKAKHTVFATATMADKVEFLSLLALVDGRVDENGVVDVDGFLKSLGAGGLEKRRNVLTGKQEVSVKGADIDFLKRLREKLQKVSNRYGFFTRNLTRLSTPINQEVDGGSSVKLGGHTVAKIEGLLKLAIEEEAAATGRKPDVSKLINASTKLSELSKVQTVVADIRERIANGEQAIVFSSYYNDAKTDKSAGRLTFTLKGKKHTYDIPSSLRLIAEELERDGIKVGHYYGGSNTTADQQFQNGDVQVILGTYAKMSEGISLDDKTGDVPRVQYHLIPDWSADVMAQAYARADRASTKSTPEIINLTGDFVADRKRGELLEVKDRIRSLLAGEDVELAYGPRNIQHGKTAEGYRAKLWGVGADTATFKAVRKRLGKPDMEGFYHFQNRQDYLQNGEKIFITALTTANQQAGLAPGFESDVSIPTDSVEGTPNPTEVKAVDAMQPLIDRSEVVVTKLTEAEERMDAAELGTKEYRNAAAQVRKWTAEMDKVNGQIIAANEKAKAPAMLAPDTPVTMDYAQEFWNEAEAGETATVGSYIDGMPKAGLNRSERRILTQLKKTVGHVPIEAVTTAEVEFATGEAGAIAAYDQMNNRIIVSGRGADVNEAYIHEAIHAAAHHALDNSPEFRNGINRLIQQAGPALQPWIDGLDPDTAAQMMSALGDVHEFVSYGLSNPALSHQLNQIVNKDRSLLQRIYEAVLNFLGAGRKTTLLKTLTDYSLANFSGNVTEGPMKHGTEKARAMLGAATARGLEPILAAAKDNLTKRPTLQLMTLRQINTYYEHVLNKLDQWVDGKNPVAAWQEAMQKKSQTVKEATVLGEAIYRDLEKETDASPGHKELVNKLLHESTRLGLWANKSIDHKDNEHAAGNPVLVAEHAKLAAMYAELSRTNGTTIYERLETYYREERERNFESAMENIFYGLGDVYYDDNGAHVPVDTEQAQKEYAHGVRTGKYDPDNFFMRTKDGDVNDQVTKAVTEGIRANLSGMLQEGPYFPLKRFGSYAVNARRSVQPHSVELTAEDIAKAEKKADKAVAKQHKADPESDAAVRLRIETLRRSKQAMLRSRLNVAKGMRKKAEPITALGEIEYGSSDTTANAESYVPYFGLRQTRREGIKLRDELRAEGGWEDISDNVVRVQETPYGKSSTNSTLVEALRSRLSGPDGVESGLSNALEAALIQLMPETSVQHEMLNRKGVEGYHDDASRALASHVQSSSWYRGQLVHGRSISKAMQNMRTATRHLEGKNEAFAGDQGEATKANEVIREVQKRATLDANPSELGPFNQVAGNVGFAYMLFSPAYMLVNMTQPGMIGLPWLHARRGEGSLSAGKAMANAYKAVSGELFGRAGVGAETMFSKAGVDPKLFDFLERSADGAPQLDKYLTEKIEAAGAAGTISNPDGVVDMMTALSERNVMDFTMATDISSAAEDKAGKVDNAMNRLRILPHLTEVLNRSVMAIAAYEMARSQGKDHKTAVTFAEKAVTETQFDYTMLNKARLMSEQQHKWAKPVFMFMQHPQHVYALFVQSVMLGTQGARRHAARVQDGSFDPSNPEHAADKRALKENMSTVVGILCTHLVAGGAVGAMFEPVKWALGLALLAFEKLSGEPPEETEVYIQRFLADVLGDDVGEVAAHGIGAAFGVHLSDNLSISSLTLMNSPGRFSVDRDGAKDLWFSAGGPLLGIAANMAEGVKTMKEGDLLGGAAKMSPRIMRDVFNAANLYTDGLQDSRGNTIIDNGEFTPPELFAETIGIRTRRKAKAYTNKAAVDNAKFFYAEKARVLQERLGRAEGDYIATRAVVQDIREYNAGLPYSMRIKTSLSPSHSARQSMLQSLGAIVSQDQKYLIDKMEVYGND